MIPCTDLRCERHVDPTRELGHDNEFADAASRRRRGESNVVHDGFQLEVGALWDTGFAGGCGPCVRRR